MPLGKFFAKNIGIDLGTTNTLVYEKKNGIIVNEPSVVAIRKDTGAIVAVGEEAKKMVGRTPESIEAIRPMKDGVVAYFDVTRKMLRHLVSRVYRRRALFKPRVVICVPSGVTEVEKRAVQDAINQTGVRESYLLEESVAAAIGADLPVEEPSGSMIVDIGGGTSEVAVISLGGIVTSEMLRVGGDEMDEAIIRYIKKTYGLMIGERTAEKIKIEVGGAYPRPESKKVEIRGRDLVTGLPRVLSVNSREIEEALAEPVASILETIKATLERTPPELAADVKDKGIMMTGGGSLLQGLDKLVAEKTGIPVLMAENPLNSVALGAGKALEDINFLKRVAILPDKKI